MLDVRHLRMVDAIARSGAITTAARALGLTQPAVSHALADLESRLGVSLFHRSRPLRPTPEGDRVIRLAGAVLPLVDQVQQDLDRVRQGLDGALRVEIRCLSLFKFFVAQLERAQRRNPEVDYQIGAGLSADPLSDVRSGKLDLVIGHVAAPPEGLEAAPLFTDEIVAVSAVDHPFGTSRGAPVGAPDGASDGASREGSGGAAGWIEVEELSSHRLFLAPDEAGRVLREQVLDPAGVPVANLQMLPGIDAVLEVVRAGFGVSAMERRMVRDDLIRGKLFARPIGPTGLALRWHAVSRADAADSTEGLGRLISDLQEATADLGVEATSPVDPLTAS